MGAAAGRRHAREQNLSGSGTTSLPLLDPTAGRPARTPVGPRLPRAASTVGSRRQGRRIMSQSVRRRNYDNMNYERRLPQWVSSM
ncbi:Hypothetical protein I596_2258 [Dokdonella koreensis DS-123]|uniref:Uncharacterized protein n=1 Tax=Dokdonella koreensis DS-123 TaxID=1300342 RepID=A0A160DUW2_9GAMM|nr:Hypothetical protein I596_2258 [Dokdonella koreensis DS-123]